VLLRIDWAMKCRDCVVRILGIAFIDLWWVGNSFDFMKYLFRELPGRVAHLRGASLSMSS
jgi:hypothetical protein